MKRHAVIVAIVAMSLMLIWGSVGAPFNSKLHLTTLAHAGTRGCSLQSVNGTYAVSGGGTVGVGTSAPVQDTEVGLLTADGNGNVSGSVTFSANGTLLAAIYTGTYTVNSDCTASASINDSLGEHLHETGVVLHGGSEIRFIGIDAGAEISRDAVRLAD